MGKITTLCTFIAAIMGMITFSAKQKVMILEEHLAHIHAQMIALRESQHILAAEWSYLNEPSRLQRLAERHLHITAGRSSTQLASLTEITKIPTEAPYDGEAMVRLASALEETLNEKLIP
jgi:hypothetical protein